MQEMGNSCKYKWSFTCLPATHLLLCCKIPNRITCYESVAWGLGISGLGKFYQSGSETIIHCTLALYLMHFYIICNMFYVNFLLGNSIFVRLYFSCVRECLFDCLYSASLALTTNVWFLTSANNQCVSLLSYLLVHTNICKPIFKYI